MTAFGAAELRNDARDPSRWSLSTPVRRANDIVNTPRPRIECIRAKASGALGDALQGNDRQVLPPCAIPDAQFDHGTRPSANECVRYCASRSARPVCSWFEARPPTRRETSEVHLVGRASAESRVWPLRVEPSDVVVELAAERGSRQRNDRQQPRALVLHRLDEPLDHSEAAVFADRAEALLDSVAAAPDAELLRRELNAVIGDQVIR